MVRNPIKESERIRVSILATYGFHYKYIASRIYGNGGSYTPSNSEIARVSRIAREEGVSPLEWRRGTSSESKNIVTTLLRNPDSAKLKAVAN